MEQLKCNELTTGNIEELVMPESIDALSMAEIKAGSNPDMDCECDHGSCYNGATLEK